VGKVVARVVAKRKATRVLQNPNQGVLNPPHDLSLDLPKLKVEGPTLEGQTLEGLNPNPVVPRKAMAKRAKDRAENPVLKGSRLAGNEMSAARMVNKRADLAKTPVAPHKIGMANSKTGNPKTGNPKTVVLAKAKAHVAKVVVAASLVPTIKRATVLHPANPKILAHAPQAVAPRADVLVAAHQEVVQAVGLIALVPVAEAVRKVS